MNGKILAAAIDFSDDYSQVSFYGDKAHEPQSVSLVNNEQKLLIPSVICVDDSNNFIYGDEAVRYSEHKKSFAIDMLVSRLGEQSKININETEYDINTLIEGYLGYVLEILQKNQSQDRPEYITLTLDRPDKNITHNLYGILINLGFDISKVRVISHTESFLYYSLAQDKTMWNNDVVMMDFNKNGFVYRRFTINRSRHPLIVDTVRKDFTNEFPYSIVDDEKAGNEADLVLAEFLKSELRKHIVTVVYLTGTGFYKDWYTQSLAVMCNKRRVFKGYNLSVKGACYAALEKMGKVSYKGMIFKCTGRTYADISIVVNHNDEDKEIKLSNAGGNVYEEGAYTECLLNEKKAVKFVISSPLSGIRRNAIIELEGFPDRPPRMTRVGIKVECEDENKCRISITDKGFGDFYAATGKVITEEISV